MAIFLRLEDFDTVAPSPEPQAVVNIEAEPGYQAGFDAGYAAAKAEQGQIDSAFVQVLSDMRFGFAEAHQHILESMNPFLAALIDQVLPAIIDDAFRARLVETLKKLAADRAAEPLRLIVHPDQFAGVSALLPRVSGLAIDLHYDAEIGPHAALISQGVRECILDLDDLIVQIKGILAALFEITAPSKELSAHG